MSSRNYLKVKTNDIEIVTAYQEFFGFQLPSDLLPKRVLKKIENHFYDNCYAPAQGALIDDAV